MNSKYPADEALLNEIKVGDRRQMNALFQEYWPAFRAFLFKAYQLPEEDIIEIYTRSFTVFYFNIKDGKLAPPLQSQLKTYLFGIGKNYALKSFQSTYQARTDHVEELEEVQKAFQDPEAIDYYEYDWQKKLVRSLLEQVGDGCKELLTLSFIEENADDAIAQKLQIATTLAVRQRRFRCLEKLRKLVQLQQGREKL